MLAVPWPSSHGCLQVCLPPLVAMGRWPLRFACHVPATINRDFQAGICSQKSIKRETRRRYPTQTGLALSTTVAAIIFAASSLPIRPVFMTRS
jgi:hypothetical protein